jgi:hypothetical protein
MNGDVLRGEIIENVFNDYIRIELQDGSIIKFINYKEIDRISREIVEVADESDGIERRMIDNRNKSRRYENAKKSPSNAGLYAFFISSTGHAYAGNWERGLPFLILRVLSGLVMISGIEEEVEIVEYNFFPDEYYTYYEYTTSYYMGLIAALGLTLIEINDVMEMTRQYNQNLYKEIFEEEPTN